MKISLASGQQMSFQAVLENWAEGMDYCAVPVPAKITEALGTKGPVLVIAQLNNSESFEVSLFPVGGGQHYIRIKAKIRQKSGTKPGDRVQVRFTVLDRANVEIPDDLVKALVAERMMASFKSLPPGQQNYAIRKINDAVKLQTREKRVQEAVTAAYQRSEMAANKKPAR